MMFMYFILSFLAFLFCAPLPVLSSPIPSNGTVIEELDKRITHSGRGTWFDVGLGNCGYEDVNSDHIVAISKSLYDANDAGNCNQWIAITDTKTGAMHYGKTRDSCPSCGYYDLDMSPSLFEEFNSLSVGVLSLSWNFMAKGWSP